MRFFPDKVARSFEEAAGVAFEEAEVAGKSSELARLFQAAINEPGLRQRAKDEMVKELKKRYGKDAWWQGSWWLVAVPSLHFNATGPPRLEIDCQPYLVGVAEVKITQSSRKYSITLVGLVGKPLQLKLPLQFLQAVLDEDMGRFPVAARDSHATSWQMPGVREPVSLPNEFLKGLTATLRRQPMADWLEDFGPQGRSLAPLVVGALIGLQRNPPKDPAPEKKSYTYQRLHERLAGMGYALRERQQLLGKATFDLRPEMTEEEALEVVLRKRV